MQIPALYIVFSALWLNVNTILSSILCCLLHINMCMYWDGMFRDLSSISYTSNSVISHPITGVFRSIQYWIDICIPVRYEIYRRGWYELNVLVYWIKQTISSFWIPIQTSRFAFFLSPFCFIHDNNTKKYYTLATMVIIMILEFAMMKTPGTAGKMSLAMSRSNRQVYCSLEHIFSLFTCIQPCLPCSTSFLVLALTMYGYTDVATTGSAFSTEPSHRRKRSGEIDNTCGICRWLTALVISWKIWSYSW